MTTKEFCKLFGMNTEEMSEFIGMTRQGLNEIVTGRSNKPSKKKENALHDLRELAIQKSYSEMQEVNRMHYERMAAVNKLFNVS